MQGYSFPKRWVKIKMPRQLSDEQRQKAVNAPRETLKCKGEEKAMKNEKEILDQGRKRRLSSEGVGKTIPECYIWSQSRRYISLYG